MPKKKRCSWCGDDPEYVAYHDDEWGIPCYDDQHLFEMINLEGAQAGLSWITILRKRENYREAFDGFDAEKIVGYKKRKIEALLKNPGIVRNRLKVEGTVKNAKAYLEILQETGSFSDYLWEFVNHKPIQNKWKTLKECPASTPESDALSKALKKRGFKFIGSTISYAFMQACGMVNDHVVDCYRYKPTKKLAKNA